MILITFLITFCLMGFVASVLTWYMLECPEDNLDLNGVKYPTREQVFYIFIGTIFFPGSIVFMFVMGIVFCVKMDDSDFWKWMRQPICRKKEN